MYTYLHNSLLYSPPPPLPNKKGHNQFLYLSKWLFSLTVDAPKIIQHPESKSVTTGASTTFTVEPSGDDLQFQWKKDSKDLHDGSKYHGTKTYILRIKGVEKSDKGNYQCLVKNDVGEMLSNEAMLVVGKWVLRTLNLLF